MITPINQDEWTVHAINIHGIFFEKWCEMQIEKSGSWSVKSTQYPVEYPVPSGLLRGKESVLDIRAELKAGDCLYTLPIECKKNNPEYTNWIFFEKKRKSVPREIRSYFLANLPNPAPQKNWHPELTIGSFLKNYPIANEARETKGNYVELVKRKTTQITRTSNASINEAAFQVALATQAIMTEEVKFSRTLSAESARKPYSTQVILPIIVTTAKILLCNFEPDDILQDIGEIPLDKVNLSEQPYMVYEYPLPKLLQKEPANLTQELKENSLDSFYRMDILVLNCNYFSTFLSNIKP